MHNQIVEHLVNVLQQENLRGLLNSETMGTCLCAPTGMMTTLTRNCNCGTSTVLRILALAFGTCLPPAGHRAPGRVPGGGALCARRSSFVSSSSTYSSCSSRRVTTPPRALASLSSPAGTGCAAGCITCSHHDATTGRPQ